jgi:hypothetical protein
MGITVVSLRPIRSVRKILCMKIADPLRRGEKWREQPLQAVDQRVGLVGALLHLSDLAVLHCDLPAQEFVVPLKQFDDARVGRDRPRQLRFCRRLSRVVDTCRRFVSRLDLVNFSGDICRSSSM